MHKLTPIFIGGALAISAGLAIAQSQLNTDTPMQGHDMPGHSMPASDNPSTQAYIEANNRMHADMTVDFTGDADIDFMKQMRGHHVAAVSMARVELAQGKDAQARNLAQEVITAQEREITLIDAWLAQKGASAAPAA